MVFVECSSNNSGGDWWLTDRDWHNLEAAGWTVRWEKNTTWRRPNADGRWLGALATSAYKEFPSLDAGIDEWETITGQCPYAEGCYCCGQPHNFYDYASLEDVDY